jgi:crossover junction endodeoxyribonuclease RusA
LSDSITFTIYGIPAPQGSKRHVGRGVMIESSKKVKPWRQDVKYSAIEKKPADWDTAAPMILSVVFRFQRPKSHFNKSGLRSSAPLHCTSASAGDLDKLLRSTNDALTGILFDDDRQVISIDASKRYCGDGEPQGAIITLTALSTDQ